jgi:hypothetical protein
VAVVALAVLPDVEAIAVVVFEALSPSVPAASHAPHSAAARATHSAHVVRSRASAAFMTAVKQSRSSVSHALRILR